MKTKLITLIILISLTVACKKDKDETEQPKLEGTWVITSFLKNGTEFFKVWDETSIASKPCSNNQYVSCAYSKIKMSSSKMTLLDDKTFVWTFAYDIVDIDLTKTYNTCTCVYDPQYTNNKSYDGSWYLDGKTFIQKDNGSSTTLDSYTIISLTNNSLHLQDESGGTTYDYIFKRQ